MSCLEIRGKVVLKAKMRHSGDLYQSSNRDASSSNRDALHKPLFSNRDASLVLSSTFVRATKDSATQVSISTGFLSGMYYVLIVDLELLS